MCTLMYPRKGEGPEFLRETLKLSLSPRLLEMLLREAGLPPEYVYELGEKNLKYKEEEGRRKKAIKEEMKEAWSVAVFVHILKICHLLNESILTLLMNNTKQLQSQSS